MAELLDLSLRSGKYSEPDAPIELEQITWVCTGIFFAKLIKIHFVFIP